MKSLRDRIRHFFGGKLAGGGEDDIEAAIQQLERTWPPPRAKLPPSSLESRINGFVDESLDLICSKYKRKRDRDQSRIRLVQNTLAEIERDGIGKAIESFISKGCSVIDPEDCLGIHFLWGIDVIPVLLENEHERAGNLLLVALEKQAVEP